MEDNIQTVLIFIISSIILFIFPVYIAYEKKDDVSYALVLKYTQEFVETISEKGYLTLDEYTEFRGKLSSTGNMYDIELEHSYNSIIPTVKYYEESGTGVYKYYGSVSRETYDATPITLPNIEAVKTYDITKEVFKTEHIENILRDVHIYMLNENDTFTVKVKNTNATLATLMYNMVSLNTSRTRIYVNCSNTVTDTKWYGKSIQEYSFNNNYLGNSRTVGFGYDYSLLHEEAPIVNIENKPVGTSVDLGTAVQNSFTIKCQVYPILNTKIEAVGTTVSDFSGYNMYLTSMGKGSLQIAIGVNGIVVFRQVDDSGSTHTVVLSYTGLITPKTRIEIAVKNETIALFVDDERVSSYELTGLSATRLIAGSRLSTYYGGPAGIEGETNYAILGGERYKQYPTYFRVYKTAN